MSKCMGAAGVTRVSLSELFPRHPLTEKFAAARNGRWDELSPEERLPLLYEADSDLTLMAELGATTMTIDGDLIHTAITCNCPQLISDEGAEQIAHAALSWLTRCPGVTVTRGPNNTPWTPEGNHG